MAMAHLVSDRAEILTASQGGDHIMNEAAIDIERIRQVALDGLMVLGMVLLLSTEIPF
jgi:hypothetical protein